MLAFLMLVMLAGCGRKSVATAEKQVFSAEGMQITLTDAFTESAMEGYTACFDSREVAVFVLKEPFSLGEGLDELALADYAQMVLEANRSKSADRIEEIGGRPFMEYAFYNNETEEEYTYLAAMYKGPDAFWMVQFSCRTEQYERYRPFFLEWAETVELAAA